MHDKQLHLDPHDAISDGMQDEHQQLREILQMIEVALNQRQARPSIVTTFIEDFRRHILCHFEHEEADGFFHDVVATAPRLNGMVEELRDQHDQFRVLLDAMVKLARQGDGAPAWWDQLDSCFQEFTKAFLAHEHAENDLFQEAYGRDIGAED